MKLKKERIQGSCGICGHEWKTQTGLILWCYCVYSTCFEFNNSYFLALKAKLTTLIVPQWPWCVSLLQSVWRIELLFILLHLHIIWPLLKNVPFPPLNIKDTSINLKDDWMQIPRQLTEMHQPAWKGKSYSQVPWMQTCVYVLSSIYTS